MQMTFALLSLQRALLPLMWGAWALYWGITSADVKATARREPMLSRWAHLGPMAIAAWLLLAPASTLPPPLGARFLAAADAPVGFTTGAMLTAAGLLFAVWARRHLGRNWSATVTLKQGHELVTSGPYALVRHPIYTGLLLAFAGSALATGEWRGLVAILIVFGALWRKLRLEERWMRERFGTAYADYGRRVKALVPFVL
jgi:protein-S-isoprenylcysteine O-methyltransferase Ste14